MNNLSVSKIEKAIKVPSRDWIGNCHGVAFKILESGLVKGKLRYGHFLGKVKRGTLFDNGVHFSRHGWIEMKDGTIVDATRWGFEGKKPYIFVGKDSREEYDIGGQGWRMAMLCPPPKFDWSEEIEFPISAKAKAFILNELSHPYVTFAGLFWTANLPLGMLKNFAKEIYEVLEKIGQKALIPMDNYNFIMQD